MKITLTPETPEDEQRLRERAKSGTGSIMSSAFSLTRALTLAAEEWTAANPGKPGPGPGSVLRHNRMRTIRMVADDGGLLTTGGMYGRPAHRWEVGTGWDQYEVLFDPSEAS